MPYNRITNDNRRRIVHKVQEGWTIKAIGSALRPQLSRTNLIAKRTNLIAKTMN